MDIDSLRTKYERLAPMLTERMRPLWVATEAEALGHGGITLVAQASRLSQARVARGIQELRSETRLDPARTRRLGGGRSVWSIPMAP